LLIAGLLNAFVSKKQIKKHLGSNSVSSVFKAALLGVPLPLCSCGVIPTGIAFNQQGASNGATVSFLVSTPQTGVDSIMITYSMLNPAWAISRPIIAFVTGIAAGLMVPKEKVEIIEDTSKNENTISDISLFDKIFKYAFVDFLQDISRPLITGIFLAVLITMFIPDEVFTNQLSNPFINMLIVLAASVPLYVCATGSVPIGAALLIKGLSPGAVLVFLMAGPATNAATITVLWKSLGKKVTLIYLVSIIGFSLLFGFMIDYVLPTHWFLSGLASLHSHEHSMLPEWLTQASAVTLILALVGVEIKKIIPHKLELNNMQTAYKIEGMTCNHCKANVEKNLSNTEGVESCEVDLNNGIAKVEGSATEEKIKAIVEGLGYGYKGIAEN
ncbi:MAG: permease, partial [Salibacteraceae bacterium]